MQTSTIVNGKETNAAPAECPAVVGVAIDGLMHAAQPGERLLDLINRAGVKLAQVCYHPQLGPIQTCDTCLVEIDGQLVRACATTVSEGMSVSTVSSMPPAGTVSSPLSRTRARRGSPGDSHPNFPGRCAN